MDSQNIGGPSAGMMFTLEIINQMTEEDITDGLRIAGTGTIRRDGTVGPIGGVKQKVFAAIDAGATVVFIPANNYDDALLAAGDDIKVVRIETIDDPLEFLGFDILDLDLALAA
jgi:PDZ domain-containing protein